MDLTKVRYRLTVCIHGSTRSIRLELSTKDSLSFSELQKGLLGLSEHYKVVVRITGGRGIVLIEKYLSGKTESESIYLAARSVENLFDGLKVCTD